MGEVAAEVENEQAATVWSLEAESSGRRRQMAGSEQPGRQGQKHLEPELSSWRHTGSGRMLVTGWGESGPAEHMAAGLLLAAAAAGIRLMQSNIRWN